MKAPSLIAELDAETRMVRRDKGKLVGCYPVPVRVKGIGDILFEETVWLGPGETLEYELVYELVIETRSGRHYYRTKKHAVGCTCGGACR